MRVIFIATVLSAFSLVLVAPNYADETQSDRVRDLIAEAGKLLNSDALSPEDRVDAINQLRELLNRSESRRERAESAPSDRQAREREMDRQRQEHVFERLEQTRRVFDEAIRRLESIPRQEFDGPTQGERRGEDIDRRGQQPDRRDAGRRDGRPMEPPRMPERPLGNFPLMQPPRFAIGIAFQPKAREDDEGMVVERVMERSPAEEAGLRQDDRVIAANDRELRDPQQLSEMVQKAGQAGREIRLKVRRGDEMLDVALRPRLSPEQDFPPGLGSISAWEIRPGQPPMLLNQLPPGVIPFAMGRPEREIEQLRRQVETMQRQIDVLRDQMNGRAETPEPGKPRERRQAEEPKPDPAAEDI